MNDRVYVVHAEYPRFIARVVEIDVLTGDPEPDQEPANILSGVTYQASPDQVLCEIVWLDAPPSHPNELTSLLEAACNAIVEWEEMAVMGQ